MGNFEKLSVLVIVVIIVMILVVALYTWTAKPDDGQGGDELANTGAGLSSSGSATDRGTDGTDWTKEIWREEEEAETPPADRKREEVVEAGDDEVAGPDRVYVPPTPTPSEPVKTDEEESTWTYVVKDGDTLSQICERELGTWKRLSEVMALNPGLDALTIRAGQKLTMPPRGRASSTKVVPDSDKPDTPTPTPGTTARRSVAKGDWYVVQRGDRLETIAKRAYGSIDRWPEMWARNLQVVKDPDRLEEGTRIYVPK